MVVASALLLVVALLRTATGGKQPSPDRGDSTFAINTSGRGVTLSVALVFALVALIGLNGEQILDARLKVRRDGLMMMMMLTLCCKGENCVLLSAGQSAYPLAAVIAHCGCVGIERPHDCESRCHRWR
jgi:hypothetical protein